MQYAIALIFIDGELPPVNAHARFNRHGKPPRIVLNTEIGVARTAAFTSVVAAQSPSGSRYGLAATVMSNQESSGEVPAPPRMTSSWFPPTCECHIWNFGVIVAVDGEPLMDSTETITTAESRFRGISGEMNGEVMLLLA